MNKNFYSIENTTRCFYKTIFWCRFSFSFIQSQQDVCFENTKRLMQHLKINLVSSAPCVDIDTIITPSECQAWPGCLWWSGCLPEWPHSGSGLRLWHRSSADCEEGLRDGRRQWRSPSQWTSDWSLVRANTEACHNAVVSTEWPEIMWHYYEDIQFEAGDSEQYLWAAHTLTN